MGTLLALILHASAADFRSGAQAAALDRGAGPAFCFVVLGDSRQERRAALKAVYPVNDVFERLLEDSKKHACDFTAHLGDIVQTGRPEEYDGLASFLEARKLSAPFFVAIGNHEVIARGGLDEFKRIFGPDYFLFDHKGWRFVFLNSARHRLGTEQRAWLADSLKSAPRAVVFSHMPPMPLQAWHDGAWGRMMARRMNTILRDDGSLTDLMAKAKVERFYAGHIHGFGQADYKGTRYILSGGAGSPFYPWHFTKLQFFHYILVRIDAQGRLSEEVCPLGEPCRPISKYPVYPEAFFKEK